MNTYEGNIEVLAPNEVFVFGSNLEKGFHGAGAAGYASFNVHGNRWREFDYANKPDGWKGEWNVKGVAEGPQEGRVGKSYALPTVKKAGDKRSLPHDEIIRNIFKLYFFAAGKPHLKFYVAQDATPGLNGYTGEEMALMFSYHPIPENIWFKREFATLIQQLLDERAEAKYSFDKH